MDPIMTRQEFIKLIATTLLVQAVEQVFSFISTNASTGITTLLGSIVNPVVTEKTSMFMRFLDIRNVIQVYPGEGNILAVLNGKNDISPYIGGALNQFAGFLHGENPKRKEYVKVLWNDPALKLSNDQDILHLGGPVANMLGGKAMGYSYQILDNGKPFPMIRDNTKLRWLFDVGEKDFGDRGDKTLRCEDGDPQKRPLYTLRDKDKLIFPGMDKEGFSLEDWLLTTKLPNSDSTKGTSILTIGGLHGHSLKTFAAQLSANISEINNRVKFSDSKYFQLLVPCRLDHSIDKTGQRKTDASILWDKIDYEPV